MLVTSRLVSPNLLAMSQTGTSAPIKLPKMEHRPQLCPLGDAEGQGVLGMGMDDGHDIRPRREDRRMNEALEIKAAVLVPHRLTVQVELDDVLGTHQLRGERAGDQEAVGIVRVTDADMPVSVDDILARQNAVGDDEILDQSLEAAHRGHVPSCVARSSKSFAT